MTTLLTADEVAERLRVSRATVYALCRGRGIGHVRIGRLVMVPEDAVEDYIEANFNPAAEVRHGPAPQRFGERLPESVTGTHPSVVRRRRDRVVSAGEADPRRPLVPDAARGRGSPRAHGGGSARDRRPAG
jgi:excisionase family DNA binding protein